MLVFAAGDLPCAADEAAALGDVTLTFGQSLVDQGMAGAQNKPVPAPPPVPASAAPPPPPSSPAPAAAAAVPTAPPAPQAAAEPAAAEPAGQAPPVRGVPLAEIAGAGGAAAASAWEGDDAEELWALARELLGNTHTVEGLNEQERAELLQILRENRDLRKRLDE